MVDDKHGILAIFFLAFVPSFLMGLLVWEFLCMIYWWVNLPWSLFDIDRGLYIKVDIMRVMG